MFLDIQLIRLLKKYNDNKRYADLDFIEKAIHILTKNQRTTDLVLDVDIRKIDSFNLQTMYIPDLKLISVSGNMDVDTIVPKHLENDRYAIYNLEILRSIMQVCYLVKMIKNYTTKDNFIDLVTFVSLEPILVAAYNHECNKKYQEFLNRVNKIDENIAYRMAYLDALCQIHKIGPYLKYQSIKQVEDYYRYELIKQAISGYELKDGKINSPLVKFITQRINIAQTLDIQPNASQEILKVIKKSNDLSNGEKIYMGLPITMDVYSDLIYIEKNTDTYKLTRKN